MKRRKEAARVRKLRNAKHVNRSNPGAEGAMSIQTSSMHDNCASGRTIGGLIVYESYSEPFNSVCDEQPKLHNNAHCLRGVRHT